MAERIVHDSIRLGSAPIGQRYGRLVSIGASFRMCGRSWQVCQCDCGDISVKSVSHLRQGTCTSCGCAQKDGMRARSSRHGKTNTPEFTAWSAMKLRCSPKNKNTLKHYAARGIKICNRWLEANGQGFLNFLADMGERPSPLHSLDRVDNDGDYCPENCRWATRSQQTRNRRCGLYLEYNGKRQTLADWAEEMDIRYSVVFQRYKLGLPPHEILDPRSRKHTKRQVRMAPYKDSQC